MTAMILEAAQTFIWGNARLLERLLFAYLFKEGKRQPVIAALRAYQNDDGGFGHALEPDKRTPNSQPVDQDFALRVLDGLGFDEEMAQRVCGFLMSITTDEGGVPFVLPTVRNAPRADWWNTDDNPPASINPTASIAGLLYKYGCHHVWLDKVTPFCWRKIENLHEGSAHDFLCAISFLENTPDRERAEQAFQKISAQLFAKNLIAFDPQAEGYVKKPLEWAPTPNSLCRHLFDDSVIDNHLEAMASQQQVDGGWPISWPAISPMCEWEYRGVVTIRALKTLKAYGYFK